jgi:hypothetical protein
VVGLAERVENVVGYNSRGERIVATKLAAGEYQTAERVKGLGYEVNLNRPLRVPDMSHVSWLNGNQGLLMMADILPLLVDTDASITINLKAPAGWQTFSNTKQSPQGYLVNNPEKALFVIGTTVRERRKRIDKTELVFLTANDWSFSDSDALKIAGRIIKEYSKLTQFPIREASFILLEPSGVSSSGWSAEARGNSVVLMFERNTNRKQALAKLGVILTHEFFHLWVPNSLGFSGDYDWFFEGFTLYQALRTAQNVGLIDFQEYLNTLARVYDSYRATLDRDRFSLIELSERRWTSPTKLVYDKGMLVAFLCDLHLRSDSQGKSDLSDLYSQLFDLDDATRRNGNEVIISMLSRGEGTKQTSAKFVVNASPIDLEALLAPFGLSVTQVEFKSRFSVTSNINRTQRNVLRSLGYKG